MKSLFQKTSVAESPRAGHKLDVPENLKKDRAAPESAGDSTSMNSAHFSITGLWQSRVNEK